MLFIQSKSLTLSLREAERLRLVDALGGEGLVPLIRATRRRCFELLLTGRGDAASITSAADEFEHQSLNESADKTDGAYTPGELFCADDCVLFLTFGADAEADLCAGIIYSVETRAPLFRLERFCRDVSEAAAEIRGVEEDAAAEDAGFARWHEHERAASQSIARFIATQPTDFAVAAKCKLGARELMRASELMEERAVRFFLRRVQEMRREGYSPRRLFAEADRLGGGLSVAKLFDAGLLEREVRVSCRKSGHALFDLPTPDSLAAITISKAKCSQCAAPVTDEVIEETINPTPLAVALLEDGGWLNNRVYQIIRSLGVPDSELTSGPVSAHGESYLIADVCGNSFLFVTNDGDLTPAFSRRIAETVTETEATHLCVVLTGAVEDEGRLRLYEFAWRRARDGHDLDTTVSEGLAHARAEIARAFERAVRRELTRRLYTLDAPLGQSASNFVLNWFKLARANRGAGAQHVARQFEFDLKHIA